MTPGDGICSVCGTSGPHFYAGPWNSSVQLTAVIVDVARTYRVCVRCAWRALEVALAIELVVMPFPRLSSGDPSPGALLLYAFSDVVLAMARAALAPPPRE